MELVRLQMRKRAYDLGMDIKLADQWYGYIQLFANSKTLWDLVKNFPDPFLMLKKTEQPLNELLSEVFYGEERNRSTTTRII